MLNNWYKYFDERECCLQAGGGNGEYPLKLSEHFKEVISVEANPVNYPKLVEVTKHAPKIRCIQGALWHSPGKCKIELFRPNQTLTGYVVPDQGEVEMFTIDSLNIKPNLIWLDIEGSEFQALSGATETLKTCRAVIIEEGKNLEKNTGAKGGSAKTLLESFGFVQKFSDRLDTLMVR